jgi:hypothetical protein
MIAEINDVSMLYSVIVWMLMSAFIVSDFCVSVLLAVAVGR